MHHCLTNAVPKTNEFESQNACFNVWSCKPPTKVITKSVRCLHLCTSFQCFCCRTNLFWLIILIPFTFAQLKCVFSSLYQRSSNGAGLGRGRTQSHAMKTTERPGPSSSQFCISAFQLQNFCSLFNHARKKSLCRWSRYDQGQ